MVKWSKMIIEIKMIACHRPTTTAGNSIKNGIHCGRMFTA